jgi:hypothetical protein
LTHVVFLLFRPQSFLICVYHGFTSFAFFLTLVSQLFFTSELTEFVSFLFSQVVQVHFCELSLNVPYLWLLDRRHALFLFSQVGWHVLKGLSLRILHVLCAFTPLEFCVALVVFIFTLRAHAKALPLMPTFFIFLRFPNSSKL